MVLITKRYLKLAYDQSQSRFRGVFADPNGEGFTVAFHGCLVHVRQFQNKMKVNVHRSLLDDDKALHHVSEGRFFRYIVPHCGSYHLKLRNTNYSIYFEKQKIDDLARFLNVLDNCDQPTRKRDVKS